MKPACAACRGYGFAADEPCAHQRVEVRGGGCTVLPSWRPWPFCGCTETVDCDRHVDMARNVPEKDWKVLRIVDRGPGHYYRFHVEGLNLNWRPERPDHYFAWSVRDLADPRYDLTDAVTVEAAS